MNATDPTAANTILKVSKMRVLLADDSAAVRQKLRQALAPLPYVEVVGESENDKDALDLFLRTRPNAVIAAICMAEHGGFHILKCINRATTDCAVILTIRVANRWVEESATLLGAAGICNATDGFVELPGILERLRNGK